MICILMHFVRTIGSFCFFILFLVCDVFADKNDDQEKDRIEQLARFQETALLHALSC